MEDSVNSHVIPFENFYVHEAITKAAQTQRLLIVYVEGITEEDQNTMQTFNDEQVIECMKECVCLKLLEDSVEAKQLKEYYPVSQTPAIYFFGLQRQLFQSSNGYLSVEQFMEKYASAKDAFSAQLDTYKQGIVQMLLLKQLQQQQQIQQQQQQPQQPPLAQNTFQNTSKPTNNAKNNNINTNNTNNNNKNASTKSPVNNNNKTTSTPHNVKPKAKEVKVINKPTSSSPSSKPVPLPERHVCNLALRLTNGQLLKAQFSPSDTLQDVIAYINQNRTDGSHKYTLMTTHPKKVFSIDDYDSTLSRLDLVPSGTLVLVSLDPTAKPLPAPQQEPSQTSLPSTSSTSSSSTSSSNDGLLSSVSNYVWGFFGYQKPQTQSGSNTAGNSSSSSWQYDYDKNKEEAIRSRNDTAENNNNSSGLRNRGPRNANNNNNVHQLKDEGDAEDDKNKFWNGNSTQYQ